MHSTLTMFNSFTDEQEEQGEEGERREEAAGAPRGVHDQEGVDHLEDGYRWRKYGPKAVKNSSYPRSYYRCTAARCGVKKRVERSHQDPSTVITTYEGQHTHPSPASLLIRGGGGGGAYAPPPPLAGLGFCPDLRAMIDDCPHATRMTTPGSLLLPPAAGGLLLPTPPRVLQEHRRSSSHLGGYGGVLDIIPSEPGSERA